MAIKFKNIYLIKIVYSDNIITFIVICSRIERIEHSALCSSFQFCMKNMKDADLQNMGYFLNQ